MKTVFKIRDKRSGKWSKKGPRPFFDGEGVEFNSLQEAKEQLVQAENYLIKNDIYTEIIPFDKK